MRGPLSLSKLILLACLGLIWACSESSLFSHKDSSSAKATRPTDDGEGVPGYLVDPDAVTMHRDGDAIQITVAVDTIRGSASPLSSLKVVVIQVTEDSLTAALHAPGSSYTVQGSLLASGPAAADGSFQGTAKTSSRDPLVVHVTDQDAADTFVLYAARFFQSAYVATTDSSASGRGLMSDKFDDYPAVGETVTSFLVTEKGTGAFIDASLNIYDAASCDPKSPASGTNCESPVASASTVNSKADIELKFGTYILMAKSGDRPESVRSFVVDSPTSAPLEVSFSPAP